MGTLIGDNTTKCSKRPKSMGIIHITQNATINVWNTCAKEGWWWRWGGVGEGGGRGGGDEGVVGVVRVVLVRVVVRVVKAVRLFKRVPL